MKEVPLIMYEYRKYLLLAFLVFAMFTTIGAISTHYDLDFVKLILGEDYVNQTLENIKKGNAVAIYGSGSNWGSAIGIIQNNLEVGAKLYAYGIFGGFGTLFALMNNSIMLGTFQYFFQQQGVLGYSMRGIWIHGAFEISAMVIEATAGFILGASLLFPKTYSRLNSFKIGFRNSFKIFVSTIPFTIFAGLLEGFVTRYALQMPLIIDLVIIFGTLGFIIFYYAIFPYRVHKKLKHDAIL